MGMTADALIALSSFVIVDMLLLWRFEFGELLILHEAEIHCRCRFKLLDVKRRKTPILLRDAIAIIVQD